jgi:hypothetical protein
MTDLLGSLGDMSTDALLSAMAGILDALGRGTEFTGEQLDRLGELERQFADVLRSARGA